MAFGVRGQRNVDGDVITVGEDLVQLGNVLDRTGQLERAVNRQIRVIAPNVHIETDGRVGETLTPIAPRPMTPSFVQHLRTGIGGLALFGGGADVRCALEALYPVRALHDLAGSEQQRADDQLLDGVGVRAWGVEDHDALLRAAVDRDIVDASASAGDALEGSGTARRAAWRNGRGQRRSPQNPRRRCTSPGRGRPDRPSRSCCRALRYTWDYPPMENGELKMENE